MILCDIGNHNIGFYNDGKMWSISHDEFSSFSTKERIYYICVNDEMAKKAESKKNFVNLEPFFEFDTIYQGMGIDRIAACMSVSDGVVVDAGSAITVDIMSNNMHLGGFILPGLVSYEESFKRISKRLEFRLNPNIDLSALPQKTEDALSYGVIKPILMIIKDIQRDKRIYFTGGDGKFFSKYFEHSIYDKGLVFRGMKRVIKEKDLENEEI